MGKLLLFSRLRIAESIYTITPPPLELTRLAFSLISFPQQTSENNALHSQLSTHTPSVSSRSALHIR